MLKNLTEFLLKRVAYLDMNFRIVDIKWCIVV